jgi:YD repeat-containing protein
VLVVVLVVVTVVVVVVIGLLLVGWAVGKTSEMPDQVVIDAHEAIEFCAEALPDEVTAQLTYDELRRLLRIHLEWIQAFHWSPEGDPAGPIVFREMDALDYVMERVDVLRLPVTREQAAAVIEAHDAYLQVAGAIHLEAPELVERDLADLPMLDGPDARPALEEGDGPGGR